MKQQKTFFLSHLVEEDDKFTFEEWNWIEGVGAFIHDERPEFIVPIPPKESIKVIKYAYKDASERVRDILYQACLENDTKSDGYIMFFTLGELPVEILKPSE